MSLILYKLNVLISSFKKCFPLQPLLTQDWYEVWVNRWMSEWMS